VQFELFKYHEYHIIILAVQSIPVERVSRPEMKQKCCGEKNVKSINREKVTQDADKGKRYLKTTFR